MSVDVPGPGLLAALAESGGAAGPRPPPQPDHAPHRGGCGPGRRAPSYRSAHRSRAGPHARGPTASGVRGAVLVNANGCLRKWGLGEVVTITDHLNLTGASPFEGTVFVDVRGVWDEGLVAVLRDVTQREGTYAALRGPEYQTGAETRMLALLGADCVGMSTVLEAIALHQLGVRVAGMSVVSDLSFAEQPTDPQEVVRLAGAAHRTLAIGVEAVLGAL